MSFQYPQKLDLDRLNVYQELDLDTQDLFNIDGINPGAGTFPSSSLQYVRITNLDNSFSVAITTSGSVSSFTQELTPTSSMFIASSNITSSNFNGSFGEDILSVVAYAISGSADVEYTLVNA